MIGCVHTGSKRISLSLCCSPVTGTLQCRHSSRGCTVHLLVTRALCPPGCLVCSPTSGSGSEPTGLEEPSLHLFPPCPVPVDFFDKLANLLSKKIKLHSEVSVKCLAVRMRSLRCSDPPASVCKLVLLLSHTWSHSHGSIFI